MAWVVVKEEYSIFPSQGLFQKLAQLCGDKVPCLRPAEVSEHLLRTLVDLEQAIKKNNYNLFTYFVPCMK